MNRVFVAGLALLICGCEKKVDFTLHDKPDKLVIEASIENGEVPVVILSKSVGYFSTISPELLTQSFVHDAEVFVSNGSVTHRLKEYTKPIGAGASFYYYSVDSSDMATAFAGELEHNYSLKVVSEGKEYTATTTIRDTTKKIDSLWWRPVPGSSDSTKVNILVRVTDKPGYGDYVRYFTKTNRQPFYPPYNSTFDDLLIDGTTYELQIEKGVDRNLPRDDDQNVFHRGDTVVIKLSNIDKATYDFWRTVEFSYATVGDPFSTPTKVLSNINGNALGYFGGYASQYRTVVIPK